MKKAIEFALALAFTTVFAVSATAACRKSHVCDENGKNCRYQDVCDSKLDLPSIQIDPIPPLPKNELQPLPSMKLPPLGTSKCEYLQVNGRWQNVCH